MRRTLTIILGFVAFSGSLWGGLKLSEYKLWQRYNGQSINVIQFPGIASFQRAELLERMATEKPPWIRRYFAIGHRPLFLADDFAADIIRLERFYARQGFLEANIEGEVISQRNGLKLKVHIEEGEPLLLRYYTLHLGTNAPIGTDSAKLAPLLSIQIGERLSERAVEASRDTILYVLRKIGHAKARVDVETVIDSAARRGDVHFTMYSGPYCFFGPTEVSGLRRVSREVVRREFQYKEGDGFNPEKLIETRRRIYQLELFSTTMVEADTSVSEVVLPVRIRLQEGRRYQLRTGIGYDSEERLRGQIEWNDRNFIGRGRRLQARGKVSSILRKAEMRLFWPHFPNDATEVVIGPKWQLEIEKGYELETVGFTNMISAEPLRRVTLRLLHDLGYAQRYGTQDTVGAPPSEYPRSVETVRLFWDTRDSPLLPTKGHLVGIELSEQGLFWKTEYRWMRGIVSGRFANPIARWTVLAGKVEAGMMIPVHGEEETPIEDRFYLGGATSVRGWQRRMLSPRSPTDTGIPIGGDASLEAAIELRRDVWGALGLACFCDAGYVWTEPSKIHPEDLLPSAGVGIRFLTPVGPLRVDFAWQLRDNPYDDTT
ncbi:BamA/TamA family outer membrane protein, partial [bacterium]|nr:BamA/TamA family outer membrane protein [bacterium]